MGRAAFGASPADLARFAETSWEQTVEVLLGEARTEPATPIPARVWHRPLVPALTEAGRQERRQQRKALGEELKAWWLAEMATTPGPLGERMVLFWHGHFTSSLRKVKSPALMAQQNQLLRRHALGNVRELLTDMLHDPALLLYLDNQQNRRQAPNENLARELFELFTLGEGHYTEADIKEGARALTGYGARRGTGEFVFRRRQHDPGDKTIFGHTGPWDGDDLVDLLLDHPRTAIFLTEKLWMAFVSDTPDPTEVARLAGVLRNGGWEIRPWVRALLNSPSFRETSNRGRMPKSPVVLVVGTLRSLQLPPPEGEVLARVCRDLGQDVLDPPNVRGWPGGERWITSSTLLGRRQLLRRLGEEAATRARGGQRPLPDGRALLVVPPLRALPDEPGRRLLAALTDPAFQVQ